MMIRTRTAVGLVAVGALVLTAGVPGALAQATGGPTGPGPPALSTAAPPLSQIRQSVDYLRRAYGVSQAEAVRRLVLQREMHVLDVWLQSRFPDNYAGMWIDQAHGGVAVLEATRPARLSSALAGVARHFRIRTEAVRFSLRRLQQVAAEAQGELGLAATATVDDYHDQVVVRMHGPAATRQARTVLGTAMRAELRTGILAVGSFTRGYGNECDPGSCTPPRSSGCDKTNCTPPFRGGINLDLWDVISSSATPEGRCTAGFDVTGSNGWVYSTTAGHCMDGASNDTSDNGHWVGYWVGGSYWNDVYPYDHAVLPFIVFGGTNYAVYWFGGHKNYVISGSNLTFPITGMYTYSQIRDGWVVCSSGTMTGTTCGSVINKDGGIVTNICQHHGDSGAPLFSQIDNKAYGLSIYDTTSDDSCPAGYESFFTPLSNVVGTQSDGVTLSVATS
jgi:streptogrisin C